MLISEELVGAAQAADAGALEALLRAAWPHAYRIARSIVGNDDAAQDAAQEACAITYTKIGTLKSPDAFRPWFFRLVAREALRRAKEAQPLSIDGFGAASQAPDIELAMDVRNALAKLPAKQRAALVLHYYAQLNSFETAQALGISAATVRFHLAEGRRRLEALLAPPMTESSNSPEVLL